MIYTSIDIGYLIYETMNQGSLGYLNGYNAERQVVQVCGHDDPYQGNKNENVIQILHDATINEITM